MTKSACVSTKRGRPRRELVDAEAAVVRELVAGRCGRARIAAELKVSIPTWKAIALRDPKAREAIRDGHAIDAEHLGLYNEPDPR